VSHLARICGVDEAGRGPWAGPVCAAAVILHPGRPIAGLTDSKRLSARRRAELAPEIWAHALSACIGWASAYEIDTLNIRQATHLAMRRAINGLQTKPREVLVDGNDLPEDMPCPARAIVKGDLTESCISAASILAKTARDAWMAEAEDRYPGYGFVQHKGYGTRAHSLALQKLGPCAIHRRSFAPVQKALQGAMRSEG